MKQKYVAICRIATDPPTLPGEVVKVRLTKEQIEILAGLGQIIPANEVKNGTIHRTKPNSDAVG